jgi:Fic family protein
MTATCDKNIAGTSYLYKEAADDFLSVIDSKVDCLRTEGKLSPAVLKRLNQFFRIRNIYNSNAIEGNQLDYNETRLVVEQGLTISGKSLQDTLEAKNLSHALTLFESLAGNGVGPITEADIRNLHRAVLQGVNDREAGKYRDVQVAISGSLHKPPGPESVAPKMDELVQWMRNVDDNVSPIVMATVIHTWFVWIHPFVDGNGRVARLLLNLSLMRHGYPIAIIAKEDRKRYYEALGESDQSGDLTPLINLVAQSVDESLEEYLRAVDEERENDEWAESLVSTLDNAQKVRSRNSYDVWLSAMELLKNQFKRIADLLNEKAAGTVRLKFKDYGDLEFEKYRALQKHQSAKQTWSFGVESVMKGDNVRFVFYFGFASDPLCAKLGRETVTLHISYSVNQSRYENLDRVQAGQFPELREMGYWPEQEKFQARMSSGAVEERRVEAIAREFYQSMLQSN